MTQEKDSKPIVFFSWQSDLDAKTNRYVISDCLRDICKKNSLVFDEATNERCGSPDIASTIEEKIRNADIFVADVTIINAGTASKTTPNPNVLFELGIAQATLGWDRIILIVNTTYAPISDLPFDIKSHRVLNYSLSAQDAVGLSNKQKRTRIYESLKNGILSILDKNPPKEIPKVNQQKRNNIERQFYEMLKIHSDNVKSLHAESSYMSIESEYPVRRTAEGREYFSCLLEEFNLIYINLEKLEGGVDIFNKTYRIFFFGIDLMANHLKKETVEFFRSFVFQNLNRTTWQKHPKLIPIKDSLFMGRMDQLIPYYRHLFLLVKTVVQSDNKLFTYDEKRQFLRILRAQLSSAEQTLLYYNWKSGCGEQWEEDSSKPGGNHFFTDYRMIHNIIPKDCWVFSSDEILQSLLEKNPDYQRLNDEDTLFELI